MMVLEAKGRQMVWGLLLALIFIPRIHGFDLAITGTEIGLGIIPEYNRSSHFSWDAEAFSSIELNKDIVLGGGVSAGRTWDVLDINATVSAEYALPFFRPYVPVFLKFAYLYNGLPEYKTHMYTLLPTLSLNWRYAGVSIGSTLRYTAFDDEPLLFEPIIAYSVYINFYNTDTAATGISFSNFNDFFSGNISTYLFCLNNRFRITSLVSIATELELNLSGSGNIYDVSGISYKGIIIFRW